MGYRAHTIMREREYGSQLFSDWQQFDSYFYKLQEEYPDDELFKNEESDFFELSKWVVEKEIERLEKDKDADFEFQPFYVTDDNKETNDDIAYKLRTALKECDRLDRVSLEWW